MTRTTGATTEPADNSFDAPTISDEPLEELMVSLQRLGRLLSSRGAASRVTTAAGADVSQQGMVLLRVLHREGQLPVAALGELAAMDLGAVSRQVRMLEAAGTVQRSRSADDGRVKLLELTPEGQEIAQRIRTVGVQHLEGALREWSAEDERTLARLMQRLVHDLVSTPVPGDVPTDSPDDS